MTITRLPDSEQRSFHAPCLDAEHDPPKFADVAAGSYLHTCPGCGMSLRIEVFGEPFVKTVAPIERPRPPKSVGSRLWGVLRKAVGALGRRPRWLWRWVWDREFAALIGDQDRATAARAQKPGDQS